MDATLTIRSVVDLDPAGAPGVEMFAQACEKACEQACQDDALDDTLDDPLADTLDDDAIDDAQIDLTAFMPLVKSIAYRIYTNIPPYAAVELSDLMQSGHLGLVHAGKAYQKSRRVPFPVYARFRIRGEILDALRRLDFASRGMRRTEKLLRSLQEASTAESEQAPLHAVEAEIPKPPPSVDQSLQRGHLHPARFIRLPPIAITSLDEQRPETANWRTTSPGPDKIHSASEARSHLDEAVRSLPPRSQELIRFYYQGGLTMREIGEHFHIKESRVSQLHRRALTCMARHLRAAGIASAGEVWELEG